MPAPSDTKPVLPRIDSAACLALALFSTNARALPPLRDPEPPPLTRAPEHLRRPVELVPKLSVRLPLCGPADTTSPCALGPVTGGELSALYRPTAYFAFGGSAWYGRALGRAGRNAVSGDALGLALAGRVYLLEEGAIDPYLEALAGVSSERVTRSDGALARETTASVASYGRAGGGIDWFAGAGVKLGVFAGYAELLPAGRGTVTAGLAASLLFGDSL